MFFYDLLRISQWELTTVMFNLKIPMYIIVIHNT